MPTQVGMIEIAKEAAEKAGGVVALARELGIKHTAMYSWARIPAERVVDIERVTGIPRQRLRPDLYDGMIADEAPETAA